MTTHFQKYVAIIDILLNKSVSVSIYYTMSQFQYLLMQTIPNPHPQYNVVFDFYQYIEHETGLIS